MHIPPYIEIVGMGGVRIVLSLVLLEFRKTAPPGSEVQGWNSSRLFFLSAISLSLLLHLDNEPMIYIHRPKAVPSLQAAMAILVNPPVARNICGVSYAWNPVRRQDRKLCGFCQTCRFIQGAVKIRLPVHEITFLNRA